MENKHKTLIDCFLCRRPFQMGPHRYAEPWTRMWETSVCNTCYNSEWDGIVPGSYPNLDAHLAERGLGPAQNAKGWIPWPG